MMKQLKRAVLKIGTKSSKAPDWGRYEIIIKNSDGFTTTGEFMLLGADVKPASEPEELSVYYDPLGQLKFEAPLVAGLEY